MVATELILPANHVLRPHDLARLPVRPSDRVVRRRPRVAILPTGSELVGPDSAPRPAT